MIGIVAAPGIKPPIHAGKAALDRTPDMLPVLKDTMLQQDAPHACALADSYLERTTERAKLLETRLARLPGHRRLADEIVDQPPSPSAIPARSRALDELQAQTHRVLAEGHSTNLVVHAFGITANDCGIDSSLIDPFFTSMRMDLHLVTNTPETFAEYVCLCQPGPAPG